MQDGSFIIIGGGGHTRVLLGMLQVAKLPISGIITGDEALVGSHIFGVPVLSTEAGAVMDANGIQLINGVGNKPSRHGSGLEVREDVYARYKARGFQFPTIVSRDAVVQPHVSLGDGVQIMPGAIIQPGANIGDNVVINTHASIEHDVLVHAHVHVAAGAVICGHSVVGERTHVGAGAVIIQGITVGRDAVVGAGTIIVRDVPDGAIVRSSANY